MLKVEEWAEVRRLRMSEGMGVKAIARQLGISRNTVRRAVRSTAPPRYERTKQPSALDPFEDRIRELLKECPDMPSTVIAERIGRQRGITVLRDRVAEIRPLYLPSKPYQRTHYESMVSSRTRPAGCGTASVAIEPPGPLQDSCEIRPDDVSRVMAREVPLP